MASTWIIAVARERGLDAYATSHDASAAVGFPNHADWLTQWPDSTPEIALVVIDLRPGWCSQGLVMPGPPALVPGRLAGPLPTPEPRPHRIVPPLREGDLRASSAVLRDLDEVPPTALDLLNTRRSAPFEAFRPGPISPELASAVEKMAEPRHPDVETELRVHPTCEQEPRPALAAACSGQGWVDRAPLVVLWRTAHVENPDVHWAAGLAAARLTLAAHRGDVPGHTRSRLVSGWCHPGDISITRRPVPVLGLALATDPAMRGVA